MTKDKALKLALEALEYASTGNRRPEVIGAAITAIKQAQPAPVQEPVAWMQSDEVHISLWKDDYHTIPLYTTPPAQEFVCSTGLCHYKAKRQWVELMRGVRVEGETVVIFAKGGNEGARQLCAALIEEMNK
jgi:hypothetical protein